MDHYTKPDLKCVNPYCRHNAKYGIQDECCKAYVGHHFRTLGKEKEGAMQCMNFEPKERT
jgi:hypothetical protein